ncbi:hypothetical protein QBC43DRAFT_324106 [Cladorrhinum sp. PSN259]|nr:hypothetical protein QBC43DRAFT_324106 [Cladorrhinum sp. PSN259]
MSLQKRVYFGLLTGVLAEAWVKGPCVIASMRHQRILIEHDIYRRESSTPLSYMHVFLLFLSLSLYPYCPILDSGSVFFCQTSLRQNFGQNSGQ